MYNNGSCILSNLSLFPYQIMLSKYALHSTRKSIDRLLLTKSNYWLTYETQKKFLDVQEVLKGVHLEFRIFACVDANLKNKTVSSDFVIDA